MQKYYKYFVFILIILISFFVVEKQATFSRNKDPILRTIIEYEKNYNLAPVNAAIEDDYIIPGIYGRKINEIRSLMKMKSGGVFNSLFLVTDNIKPDISIEDNKDKIISLGNQNKQAISLLLEVSDENIINYLISNNIKGSILVNKQTVNTNSKFEQINNDFKNYREVDKILNKSKSNTNICILNRTNKDFCLRNKKYLVEPTIYFNSSNLVIVKNKITSGYIILVKDNVSVNDLSYLIKYIKTKGLDIIYLSELISEK